MEECFKVEKELLDDHENELKDLLASLKLTTISECKNIPTIFFTMCVMTLNIQVVFFFNNI
jgi:hypothetical protein